MMDVQGGGIILLFLIKTLSLVVCVLCNRKHKVQVYFVLKKQPSSYLSFEFIYEKNFKIDNV